VFPTFLETHGPALAPRQVPAATLRKYQGKLPGVLLEHWKSEGFAGYGSGLLWVADPAQLQDPLNDWVGDEHPGAIGIARSAFGDMLFWHGGEAHYLHVLYGRSVALSDDLELLFEYTLCKDSYLDDVVDRKLFKQALKKYGPLQADEVYAFVPAIAAGGSGKLANIQKQKLREHLSFLAQL